ncbi:MAG TPA: hypothetical protein PKA84_01385 [Rubrivivax sp.]|nr:hypothetical protein [Rubrivivax sp.]HMR68862.1 hypothetical protein [Rubrivivax sp.]
MSNPQADDAAEPSAAGLHRTLQQVMAALRSGEIDIDAARVISLLADKQIALARVELDYQRHVGAEKPSGFLEGPPPNGILSVRRHLLRDE